MPEESVEIIPDESEALKKALKLTQNGDVIAVFFEKLEPLQDILMNYKKENQLIKLN